MNETLNTLRQKAQEQAAYLPPLLADAQYLASGVMGAHGRRRAGAGDEFWQFRNALPWDNWRHVDWRRSGRSDTNYVRQREWQAAQSVHFWIDGAQSMGFSGAKDRPDKGMRAAVLGLATAILLVRGGERVGLTGDPDPAKSGDSQIAKMGVQLGAAKGQGDYGVPGDREFPKGSRAVFLSDFLGRWSSVRDSLGRAADRGVRGALVQVLDPVEEAFPFDGRTVFESMSGAIRFETLRARGLRNDYLRNLAARKAELQELCAVTGWQYMCHHTTDSPQSALMWIYSVLEKARG